MDRPPLVDCQIGQKIGCAAYCCRLLVRLDEGERVPPPDGGVAKGFVDKYPDSGLCVHFNEETGHCDNWENRPRACRDFDCNADWKLQVVLRDGFCSLTTLVTSTPVPPEKWVQVPLVGSSDGADDRETDDRHLGRDSA